MATQGTQCSSRLEYASRKPILHSLLFRIDAKDYGHLMQVEKLELQGVPALKIIGEIDLHASTQLRELAHECLEQRCTQLVIDMSEVDYIDSSGLAVLIEYIREAQSFGGKLGLFGLSEKVLSIFRLVGLDKFFVLEETLEATLARLGN